MRAAEMRKAINEVKTWPYWTHYLSIPAMQWPGVLEGLDALADAMKDDLPEQIIEIGTAAGGFTCMLRDHDLSRHAIIDSFDIVGTGALPLDRDLTLHRGNVFSDLYQRVREMIRSSARTVLFCDGGDKVKEVNTFACELAVGGVICMHDFEGEDGNAHGWPWVECRWRDVKDALRGFEPFAGDAMRKAAWGCFRKVKSA